jgi:beta-aspartyl-peptidase (threonine type)
MLPPAVPSVTIFRKGKLVPPPPPPSDLRGRTLLVQAGCVVNLLILFLLFTFPSAVVSFLTSTTQADTRLTDKAEINRLLLAQAASWNEGDLAGFMDGYWNSPELQFRSKDEITKGWQATFDRFRDKYQKEGKDSMGRLTFSDLEVEVYSLNDAMARGRWKLVMKSGETPNGLFTLLLKKIPQVGWRIVYDHTSAVEPKKVGE